MKRRNRSSDLTGQWLMTGIRSMFVDAAVSLIYLTAYDGIHILV